MERVDAPSAERLAGAGFPVQTLTPDELDLLQRGLREIPHKRRHCIFRQDDPSDGIHCVVDGEVLLESVDYEGNQIAFFIAAKGDLIGYRSLFAEVAHAATARALSSCRTFFIPAAVLHRLIAGNPELGRAFLRLLALDPGPIAAPLLRNPYIPAGARLGHLLQVLGEQFGRAAQGGGITFGLPLSRSDIAALIGARRETVARLLREFERAGVVRLAKRNLVVTDPARLAALAAGGNLLPG